MWAARTHKKRLSIYGLQAGGVLWVDWETCGIRHAYSSSQAWQEMSEGVNELSHRVFAV